MNKYYKIALQKDLAGDYKGAIEGYIKSIEEEEMVLDAHLNLIVILIEVVFDYGVTSSLISKGIFSQNEINELYEYLTSILKKTELLFESNEIKFWKYLKESYYEGVEREEIQEIIDLDPNNLVPYFQLYIIDLELRNDIVGYKEKIDNLKNLAQGHLTIKNKYILSLLESAENLKI